MFLLFRIAHGTAVGTDVPIILSVPCKVTAAGIDFRYLNSFHGAVIVRHGGYYGDRSTFSETLLKHRYTHKVFICYSYRLVLSATIYEDLRAACKLDEAQPNPECYGKSMFAGLLLGWLDKWMLQGMPESPEELFLLTANFADMPKS